MAPQKQESLYQDCDLATRALPVTRHIFRTVKGHAARRFARLAELQVAYISAIHQQFDIKGLFSRVIYGIASAFRELTEFSDGRWFGGCGPDDDTASVTSWQRQR